MERNSFFNKDNQTTENNPKRELFFKTTSKTSTFFNMSSEKQPRRDFGFFNQRKPVNGITAGNGPRKFRIPRGSRFKGRNLKANKNISQGTNFSNQTEDDVLSVGSRPFSANKSNTSLSVKSNKH